LTHQIALCTCPCTWAGANVLHQHFVSHEINFSQIQSRSRKEIYAALGCDMDKTSISTHCFPHVRMVWFGCVVSSWCKFPRSGRDSGPGGRCRNDL
jgi:hypothetical protein